jgi:uncharacterized membrane protein YphA (DoxX/SURF4 family)
VIKDLSATLVLWPGIFCVVAGLGKALEIPSDRSRDDLISRVARDWLPAPVALAAVAVVELSLGGFVLGGVWPVPIAAITAAFLAGAAVTAAWGSRRAPEGDCGCMGALGSAPLDWRTFTRAGVLALMATAAVASGEPWRVGVGSPGAGPVLICGGAILIWLSPEINPRRWIERLRSAHAARCGSWYVSIRRALAQLHETQLWRTAEPRLLAERPTDHWRRGCWLFVCFPAAHEDTERATAVFALPLDNGRPGAVTFVDEASRRVLGRIGPTDSADQDGELQRPELAGQQAQGKR